MTLKRRQFTQAALSIPLLSTLSSCISLVLDESEQTDSAFDYVLVAKPAPITVIPNTTTPGLTFNGGFPAPVIRAKQGKRIRIKLVNELDQPTTIHWHGIRIDNAMDGVPWLTQRPVMPGESFIYDFVCPDAGTFWYHPHVNSLEQLGKGMVGALIVEEEKPVQFDQEVILGLKDWILNNDGSFGRLSTPRQAARMGTLGNIQAVNGQIKPTFEIESGASVRLRLLNIDNTRVFNLAISHNETDIIAIDGNAITTPYRLDSHACGAGMRLDLALVAPKTIGEEVVLYDVKGRFKFEVCRLITVQATRSITGVIPTLPISLIPEPDLDNAERLSFVFEWAGALSPVSKDGKVKSEFWTINKRAWKGMSKTNIPEPLATLSLGKTYLINLHNATPHSHPIHLHGFTFKVIQSDKRKITPYHTDTILLEKNERAQIAFVADNPGDWMYHCHVIEHMKTGLMGYIRVADESA